MATHDNSRREHPSTWLEYRAGTPAGQSYYESWSRGMRTIRPFIQKWSRLPDDYDAICRQALQDIQSDDFYAFQHLLTVWGQTATKKERNVLSMDTH